MINKDNIEISCGIIPVFINKNKEKEFLIVKANTKSADFSFPKGHIETNETFLETAKRELKEETGLECYKILSNFMITEEYIRKDIGRKKQVHYFIGFVDTKKVTIQEEEINDYFWGAHEDILDMITHRSAKDLFLKALDHINNIVNIAAIKVTLFT